MFYIVRSSFRLSDGSFDSRYRVFDSRSFAIGYASRRRTVLNPNWRVDVLECLGSSCVQF